MKCVPFVRKHHGKVPWISTSGTRCYHFFFFFFFLVLLANTSPAPIEAFLWSWSHTVFSFAARQLKKLYSIVYANSTPVPV